MFHIAAVIVLTLTIICGSQGRVWFWKDGKCVAAPPCVCNDYAVECSGLQLRAMPTFIPRVVTNDSLDGSGFFRMSSNNIEVIEDRAFCNLTFASSSRVFLFFSFNAISSLDDNAFDCIQNNIEYIDLENNRLTELPLAMLKLSNLKKLYLQNNPLVHLNPLVMRQLGPTLTTLRLDLGRFSTWPSSFSHLSLLSSLSANNITFTFIPEDGFSGFNSSLTALWLYNSRLASLPQSFCRMPRLRFARVEVLEPMDLKNILPFMRMVAITVYESKGLLEYTILTRNSTIYD